LSAAAFLLGTIAGTAQAIPVAFVSTAANPNKVAGECGAGWHRGPLWRLPANYVDPDAHGCPRGYQIGPGGECRGNGK